MKRFITGTIIATLIGVVVIGCSKSPASLQRRADEFVKARQEKWLERHRHISEVTVGVERAKVLGLLGEPDAKSDSPTVENWLFKYDAGHNEEQIWVDAIIVQITDGKVTNVRPGPTRLGIEEMLERAEKKAK